MFKSKFLTTRNIIILGVVSLVVIILVTNMVNAWTHTTVTCKVIKATSQQLIENSGDDVKTNIRYLVVTDKGTFTCETSILN